jgi:hypothetical protein
VSPHEAQFKFVLITANSEKNSESGQSSYRLLTGEKQAERGFRDFPNQCLFSGIDQASDHVLEWALSSTALHPFGCIVFAVFSVHDLIKQDAGMITGKIEGADSLLDRAPFLVTPEGGQWHASQRKFLQLLPTATSSSIISGGWKRSRD